MATVLALGLCLGAFAKDDAEQDQKMLQGKWMLTSAVLNGTEVPKDDIKGELVFKENKYSYTAGDGQAGAGTFKLDPSKKPKQLDAVPSEGDAKGQTFEEIYEIDGDSLKLCLALPGTKRPTDFKSEAGSLHMLFIYKRAK
jgi:uncharacterized protein (TIGR03067 family)